MSLIVLTPKRVVHGRNHIIWAIKRVYRPYGSSWALEREKRTEKKSQRAFGGLYYCEKFGWNICGSFDNMQVLIFCDIGLKTQIQVPEIGVCGGQKSGKGFAILKPTNSLLLFGGCYLCATFGGHRWRNATMRAGVSPISADLAPKIGCHGNVPWSIARPIPNWTSTATYLPKLKIWWRSVWHILRALLLQAIVKKEIEEKRKKVTAAKHKPCRPTAWRAN